MHKPLLAGITLATIAKFLAILSFLLVLPLLPTDTRFSLYGKQEFIGRPSILLPPWIVNWANFDGFEYLTIARRGHTIDNIPFFPLYPFTIHAVYDLTQQKIPSVVVGQLISFGSFAVSCALILSLLTLDKASPLSRLLFLVLLLFPTSYSYTAVYNDSIFFALACAALVCARKRSFFWASVLAAAATLARLNGIALFPFLIVEYVEGNTSKKPLSWSILWSLLVPLALLFYFLYIQVGFGSWTMLFSSMKPWGQDHMITPMQTLYRYAKMLTGVSIWTTTYWVAFLELGSFLWYGILLFWSWKKIRRSYWIFWFFSILIPALTGTFQGMPRYGLHLYPFFLTTAILLAGSKPWIRIIYISLSLLLYLFCLTLFTHGIFIA